MLIFLQASNDRVVKIAARRSACEKKVKWRYSHSLLLKMSLVSSHHRETG